MERLEELLEEFRSVLAGRAGLIDVALPPIAFLLANALFGFTYTMSVPC